MKKIYWVLFLIFFFSFLCNAEGFPIDSAINLNQFQLNQEQIILLQKNGFAVMPDQHQQLFSLYTDNWWRSVPSFITSDLILQVYHLLFSKTVQRIEYNELYPSISELSLKMFDKSKYSFAYWYNQYKFFEKNEPIDSIIRKKYLDIIYFGIACHLLGIEIESPPIIDSLCNTELSLILKGEGRKHSSIFPFDLDYSQFIPRGHYNSNERMQRFFRGMMWYGLVPLPFDENDVDEKISQDFMDIAITISSRLIENDSLLDLWKKIYDVTSIFSGKSEYITPEDVLTVLKEISKEKNIEERNFDEINWGNLENFYAEFRSKLKDIHPQKIIQHAVGIPTGLQFRFFGQRYLPDSEILQRLAQWPERRFSKGLDIFAVLGSERAYEILNEVYEEQKHWSEYPQKFQILKNDFSGLDTSFWFRDIYHAWLYTLLALTEPVSESYPPFMKTVAWKDKSLNTSLASWAEMRHDVILYAVPFYAEADVPSLTNGYVESNPEFYFRSLKLLHLTKFKLTEYNLLRKSQEEIISELEDVIEKLKAISEKELTGETLTKNEYYFIWSIGNFLDPISAKIVDERVSRWYCVSGTERFMACIADVGTSLHTCLEEGVGYGNTILVLVPIEGKWTLARGAVFSYYEFTHPIDDRLTDEKWQSMLKQGNIPPPPIWTKSFLSKKTQ